MKRHTFFSAILICSLFFASCSLKYSQEESVTDVVPEFSFEETVMTKYEDNKKNTQLKVGQLEQFKNGYSMFAKDVNFSFFDEDGSTVSMEGQCEYLSADTRAEIYELYESIKIRNKKEGMNVSGRSFHWNGKTEQLAAGRNDTVTIEKDGMVVRGSGFAASGASSTYSFNSVVTGNIETKDE